MMPEKNGALQPIFNNEKTRKGLGCGLTPTTYFLSTESTENSENFF